MQADYATTPAQTANGGAIISTRDAVTFGFGLEQVDAATRAELLKRALELPAADHGRTRRRRRSSASSTRPTTRTATPADPVEVERHRVRRARRHEAGQPATPTASLVGTVPVYPFQFRYTPPASAVGQTVTLTAEAVDKAGNSPTSGPARPRRRGGDQRPVAGAGRQADDDRARRRSARR